MSDRLIALSEKIQVSKLGEMRSSREAAEVKEKNNYLSRLLRTANENLKHLEEKVAEIDSKMHKREEEFRRADNERMRRFFNARFDDIPAAFHQEKNRSSLPRGGSNLDLSQRGGNTFDPNSSRGKQ